MLGWGLALINLHLACTGYAAFGSELDPQLIYATWSTHQHKAWIIPVSPAKWWNCYFWGAILVHQIASMMGVATEHQSRPDQWQKLVWHFFGHYFPFFSISGLLLLRRWSIDSWAACFCLTVQGKMLWRDTCMKSVIWKCCQRQHCF